MFLSVALLIVVAMWQVSTTLASIALLVFVLSFRAVMRLLRRGPRVTRWLGSGEPKWVNGTLKASELGAFEVDLPCEKCGASNIGTEGGMWEGRRAFRTCDVCGFTQWWTAADNPPLVSPRRRPLKPQLQRSVCPKCDYHVEGTPLRREDRGSGVEVLVQQCPECGRSEIVVAARPGDSLHVDSRR